MGHCNLYFSHHVGLIQILILEISVYSYSIPWSNKLWPHACSWTCFCT